MDESRARYSRGVRQAAELVRRRWTVDILVALVEGERRTSQIKAALVRISDQVLSDTLTQAVNHQLVERTEIPGRPGAAAVWYQLTPMGRDLIVVLRPVAAWAQRWLTEDQARYSRGVRQAAELVRRRWTVDILVALVEGEQRTWSEIKAVLDGISDKVLSHTLTQAVNHQLVGRTEIPGRPGETGVWYQITPMSRDLMVVLRPVAAWAQRWTADLPEVP